MNILNVKSTKIIKMSAILFIVALVPLTLCILPKAKSNNSVEKEHFQDIPNLDLSLPPNSYAWWNDSWDFRVPVGITADGSQQDAPVELFINFTKYFNDLDIQNPELNVSTIRVVEYLSISIFFEVESQFDPYSRSFDSQTNAIGDLIWILNGSTANGHTRDFFIYFHNGTSEEILKPNYDTIRIWHEGFEEYQPGDILRPTDGQDIHPDSWEISNTTSARGTSSLRIWGNCWKMSATGSINVNSDTRVTAKMRFDDPDITREISGLGFDNSPNNIPTTGNSYKIRGSQSWGTAGSDKFVNMYYLSSTFFWYTFIPSTEFSLDPFTHIVYIADDDSYSNVDLYWDDISIWNKPVQTTPNNSLQTVLGDIQPIAYVLEITCVDEEGNPVPDAHIFISNNLQPTLNQDNYSGTDGKWSFSAIDRDALYNITIDYTQNGLISPTTETVFYFEDYVITDLNNYFTAHLNITTINFDINDKDGDPVQYGHVVLKDGTLADVGYGTLSSTGKSTLRWINNTNYNYEVYYDFDALPDVATYRYDNLKIANGIVLIGTHDVNLLTEITKINFNVTQFSDGTPFVGAKLRLFNTSDINDDTKILANVTVETGGFAKFIAFSNETGIGWGNYTLDLYFGGDLRNFYANATLIDRLDGYNFTLNHELDLNIRIDLNMASYNTTISFNDISNNIYWGDNVTIGFDFVKRDPIEPAATLVTPKELFLRILDDEQLPISDRYNILSSEISIGVFNYEFNTTKMSLIGGNRYWIEVTGNYKSYVSPDPLLVRFEVLTIATGVSLHDYTSMPDLLPTNEISQLYNELVNITIKYYDFNTNNPLIADVFTYEWDFGSGSVNPDPINPGYYTTEINTSAATNIGKYLIEVSIELENYTNIYNYGFFINILSRPTTLNDEDGIVYLSEEIFIFKEINFTFNYEDAIISNPLSSLDEMSYLLQKLDENGDPIPGTSESGSLIEGVDIFILDLDTETRLDGEYSIIVTFDKLNYDHKIAVISLTIMKREIDFTWESDIVNSRLSLNSGESFDFILTLKDPHNETNPNAPIIGANVTLSIRDIVYSTDNGYIIDNGDGTYRVMTFPIAQPFFMPEIFVANLTIDKQYFSTASERITVVVAMQEILGMPMFYFLMIVGSVVAVVASLTSYRLIQQSRIPSFVKNARSMKKEIKGNKSISESNLYPTKEEYIVKKLGDKWDAIGLSLLDVMGIKGKKKKLTAVKEEKPKKLPKVKEEKVLESKSEPKLKPEPEKKEEFPEDEYNESYGGEP